VNALSDARVADYLQDRFVATYLKVGTFQIIGGRKVGGNVASYFCLPDGSVVHAVVGPSNGTAFLTEARWAWETRRSALTLSTDLVSGQIDPARLQNEVRKAHQERYVAAISPGLLRKRNSNLSTSGFEGTLPVQLPRQVNQQAQVNWLLASSPLARIDDVYPTVWQEILRERLSGLPVAMR
jgi:hypothetical protein